MSGRDRFLLAVCAALCALLALWVRAENAIGIVRRVDPIVGESWGSYDPDTLYHARRVERGIRDRGWIAAYDPLLDHPHPPDRAGAPIPWPPAYDLLLTGFARGAPPDLDHLLGIATDEPPAIELDAGARAHVERLVATVPMVCGALTALLAALFAAGLARRLAREPARASAALGAALFAGASVALTFGHVRYSHLGNGDHHAFVSLLHVLLLGLVGRALAPERIVRPVASAFRGAFCGIVAGVLVASWTASILWVALLEFALALRLWLPFRTEAGARAMSQGLPLFATSFHKTALLVLLPAVIESPFTTTTPFSVVDLSWFHLVWLSAGWLVFAPYALAPKLATQRPLAATIPAVALLALVALSTDVPGRLLEAFSWAGATNAFMGSITESQPLVGAGGSLRDLVKFAGAGVLLAPVAWPVAALASRRDPGLLPWVVTLPALCLLAALQRRFAEGLAAPLAVVLGAVVAAGLASRVAPLLGPSRRGALLTAGGLTLAAFVAHPWTVRNTWSRFDLRRTSGERFVASTPVAESQRVVAELLEGLASDREGGPAVLAEWDLGHAIEWRARRPTVASNFGLYLGLESFLTPWRYFAEDDDERAAELLRERDVGHVLIDARTRWRWETIQSALGEGRGAAVPWDGSMAARLLGIGDGGSASTGPPANLRLVRLVADPLGESLRVYEVVEGARLRARARRIDVVVTLAGERGAASVWRSRTEAQGEAAEELVLRVPYALDSPAQALDARGTVRVIAIEVVVDGELVPSTWRREDVRDGALVDLG